MARSQITIVWSDKYHSTEKGHGPLLRLVAQGGKGGGDNCSLLGAEAASGLRKSRGHFSVVYNRWASLIVASGKPQQVLHRKEVPLRLKGGKRLRGGKALEFRKEKRTGRPELRLWHKTDIERGKG